MVFSSAIYKAGYGTVWWYPNPLTYCQNNTSASDYGNCYNIVYGQAIFVQTDTTTYPTLPCQSNNTCTRYTSTINVRSFGTVFSYSGKQGIVQFFSVRSHAPGTQFNDSIISSTYGLIVPTITGDPDGLWFFPSANYEASSWPVYDPVANFKMYINPYTITSGFVAVLRWQGSFFTPFLYLAAFERNQNNIWYAADVTVIWAYESSPLAIIPLDYSNDYAPYRELRDAFGYAATGVDQPGWNAQDIITALQDIFPNRAWAVYDDVQKILYLYNLTMDYVPDWLINKLAPVGVKVLQSPSDTSVAQAWLNGLNVRNQKSSGP